MDVVLDLSSEINGMTRSMLVDTPDPFRGAYGQSNHNVLLLSIYLKNHLDASFFEFFSVVENGEIELSDLQM